MIRFIDIGTQTGSDSEDDPKEFALYDTVQCCFITIGPEAVWSGKEDFLQCCIMMEVDQKRIDRLSGVIPGNWPES